MAIMKVLRQRDLIPGMERRPVWLKKNSTISRWDKIEKEDRNWIIFYARRIQKQEMLPPGSSKSSENQLSLRAVVSWSLLYSASPWPRISIEDNFGICGSMVRWMDRWRNGWMVGWCLSLFWLLAQNTTYLVAYKQRKFIYFFKRFYLFTFREVGIEGKREGNINVWETHGSAASHTPSTRDPACNPDTYPTWKLNWQTFGS